MNSCSCIPTVIATSSTVSGTTLVLNTGGFAGALPCNRKFNLRVDFCIPNANAGLTVSISDGTNTYAVVTRHAAPLYVSQLLCRGFCKRLHMRLSDLTTVQCLDCLPEGCLVGLGPDPDDCCFSSRLNA